MSNNVVDPHKVVVSSKFKCDSAKAKKIIESLELFPDASVRTDIKIQIANYDFRLTHIEIVSAFTLNLMEESDLEAFDKSFQTVESIEKHFRHQMLDNPLFGNVISVGKTNVEMQQLEVTL